MLVWEYRRRLMLSWVSIAHLALGAVSPCDSPYRWARRGWPRCFSASYPTPQRCPEALEMRLAAGLEDSCFFPFFSRGFPTSLFVLQILTQQGFPHWVYLKLHELRDNWGNAGIGLHSTPWLSKALEIYKELLIQKVWRGKRPPCAFSGSLRPGPELSIPGPDAAPCFDVPRLAGG